jgi:hypothetical protein
MSLLYPIKYHCYLSIPYLLSSEPMLFSDPVQFAMTNTTMLLTNNAHYPSPSACNPTINQST